MGHHQVTNKAGLVGWYDVHSDMFEPITCWNCDEPFTQKAWDDRHSDSEGNDVHAHCCDLEECKLSTDRECVELRLVVFFPEYDDDKPHPMVAFTDDLDDLIEKHFPEDAEDASYHWEHI